MTKESRDDYKRGEAATPVGYLDERSGRTRALEGTTKGPFIHAVTKPHGPQPFRSAPGIALNPENVAEVSGVPFDSSSLLAANRSRKTMPVDVEEYSALTVLLDFLPETADDYLFFILQVSGERVNDDEALTDRADAKFFTYPLTQDELTQRRLMDGAGQGIVDQETFISRIFHPVVYRTPRIAAATPGTTLSAERLAIPFDVTPFKTIRLWFGVENDDGEGTIGAGDGTVSLSYLLTEG